MGEHIYQIYDPIKHKVFQSRDVIFVEGNSNQTKTNPPPLEGENISDANDVDGNRGVSVDSENDDAAVDGDSGDSKIQLCSSKQTHIPSYKIMASALLVTAPTPQSYQQAINSTDHVHWQNAMLYKYDKIMEHKVAVVVDIPDNYNVIKGCWIYNTKSSANNEIEYRAQYIGKGFSKVYGIDFTNTFAPVARITSL